MQQLLTDVGRTYVHALSRTVIEQPIERTQKLTAQLFKSARERCVLDLWSTPVYTTQ